MPVVGADLSTKLWFVIVSFALASFFGARAACAQSTIKDPGRRPHYALELEPHLILSPFGAPDMPANGGYGIGARATIELLPDGFLPELNDSVGLGFGLDWARYQTGIDSFRAECRRFQPTAQGVPVCVDVGGGSASYVLVPIVMQWNFWLHSRWSAFGEPGLVVAHRSGGGLSVAPDLGLGGRFHASDDITLTLRLGYPAFTFGVSFLL
jgi:hypothetical protein